MKFYLSQIDQLFVLIEQGTIKALLLYGPDKGYIDKICATIIKKFDFLQSSIEYSALKASSLEMLLNSQNFFMKKELIKIRSVTSSIAKDLKIVLGRDYSHFVTCIADELAINSSTRKFFETEHYLASIGCYYDDEPKIIKIILHKCSKAGKIIQEDALTYLKSYLRGDHQLICSEIDKLLYFTFDKDHISLGDVQSIVSGHLIASTDDLSIYFAQKDLDNFLYELTKLKQHNINEILIIRALIRYYLNLYIVLSKIENNSNVDDAIKSLSPPIFYKYINEFKKIVNKLTMKNCIQMISFLQQAEIEYKLAPDNFDLYSLFVSLHECGWKE